TGLYAAQLPAGEYRLRVSAPGRRGQTKPSVSVTVGGRAEVPLRVSELGRVRYAVREGAAPSPAKLTFVGLAGTPDPWLGPRYRQARRGSRGARRHGPQRAHRLRPDDPAHEGGAPPEIRRGRRGDDVLGRALHLLPAPLRRAAPERGRAARGRAPPARDLRGHARRLVRQGDPGAPPARGGHRLLRHLEGGPGVA